MSPSEKTRDMPDIGDITNIGDFFTEFSLFNRISDNGECLVEMVHCYSSFGNADK